jgi:hypothetical protein
MGVNYRVWVIPKQRSFRPLADQVANLANALREGEWVPKPDAAGPHSKILELLPSDKPTGLKPVRTHAFTEEAITPGWVEFHSQHELVLHWSVQNQKAAGVQFPFVFDPYPDSGPPYFQMSLILGDEYFHFTGENVMDFEEQATRCECGEQMAYWTGWAQGAPSQRIHRICPQCGRNFDVSGISCDVIEGWTGEHRPLAGGLTFRFGLLVDCHKYWPHEEELGKRYHLRPDFLELWHKHIGVPFEIVVTFD